MTAATETLVFVLAGIIGLLVFLLLMYGWCCTHEGDDEIDEEMPEEQEAENHGHLTELNKRLAKFKKSFDPQEFTLVEEIHATKFSQVIKVNDKKDGSSYCMKRMNAKNPNHLKHCIREVDTLARLDHENIVKFYGVGFEETEMGNWICILLEYVVGGTIADVIRFGKFGTQLTQSFSKQILFGLEYLHHNNIVHRDLKGRNVLVCKNGLCKLSDFGTSSFFENPASYRAGTLHWMAPETFEKYREMPDAEIIKRQDIWSFGACIFEMMCGHPPLHTLQELQVVYWHSNYKDLEYPDSIARDPILLDMVKRCVRLKPENRPTPTDLLEHPFFEQEYTDEEPGRLSIRSDSWGSNSMNFTIF